MATTFDRETLLDLVVNVIPLVIILFFVVAFAVVQPFGGDRLGEILMYVLLLAPFLALAVLTYVSGKVIVADERRAELFHQGQAPMDDATPREGHGESTAQSGDETAAPAESSGDTPASDDATPETADEPEPAGGDETVDDQPPAEEPVESEASGDEPAASGDEPASSADEPEPASED